MTRTVSLLILCCSIALTAVADTKSWTGAVSNLWSVGGNWNGGIAPVSGDALVFPNGATNRTTSNDIVGLSMQSVSIAASSYGFSGNAITLSGGVSTECCAAIAWNVPTTLAASQTFNDRSITTFDSTIDLNGHTLTLNPYITTLSGSIVGSGGVIVGGAGGLNLTGTSTFTGPFTVSSTAFQVAGTITNSTLTVGNGVHQMSGAGSVPETSLSNTTLSVGHDPGAGCCADPQSTGILSTGNLSISGGTVRLDLVTPTAGTGYDQINTTGTVTLSNPSLQLVLPSGLPAAGQSFAIINNDGVGAVTGTFNGLGEGAVFAVGPARFRITYIGGSGNDVVVTALAETQVALTSSTNPAVSGEPFLLTAQVTSGHGTPTGMVVFEEGSTVLGMVALDGSGRAALTTQRPAGSHSIIARYIGAGNFAPGNSTLITQTVSRAGTALTVSSSAPTITHGEPVTITGSVTPLPPGTGVPSGTAVITVNGQAAATVPLNSGGMFSTILASLTPGIHTVAVSYAGDSEMLGANGSIDQQVFARITALDAAAVEAGSDTTVQIVVSLSAASNQPVTVAYATADSTASAGADYVSTTGILDFPPGVSSLSITITIKGDTSFEQEETFRVVLSNATNSVIERSEAIVTISDAAPIPALDGIALLLLAIGLAAIGIRFAAQ